MMIIRLLARWNNRRNHLSLSVVLCALHWIALKLTVLLQGRLFCCVAAQNTMSFACVADEAADCAVRRWQESPYLPV